MKYVSLILLLVCTFIGCSKSKQNTNKTTSDAASLHVFRQGGEFGYKDAAGTVVIKPQFAEAGEFSEEFASVRPDPNGPWGYINSSGEAVISPQFEGASDFRDGKAVILSNEKFFYISSEGKRLGSFDQNVPNKPLSVGDTLYVIHPNGLIARALGDLNASAMGRVQFGEAVTSAYDPHPKRYQTIDGLRGTWLSVRYQNKQGYLFDLYLSKYPQALEKRPVETYRVVVSSRNDNSYSAYRLTRYFSGGRLNTHDGSNWTESQEIIPNSNVEEVIARLKLFPMGEIGPIVQRFTGESGSYTTDKGETVVVAVRRYADGFFETVSFSKKSESGTFDFTLSRFSTDDVEITTSATSESDEAATPSEIGD